MLKIKAVREKKGLSQDAVVKATGIPKRSYVNYENGITDIPFSKLQNIAHALKVKVEDLINEGKSELVEEPELSYGDFKSMHLDVKQDLKALAEGMTHNFEVLSRGMKRSLQGQQTILDFIGQLDVKQIKNASEGLQEFLKERQ